MRDRKETRPRQQASGRETQKSVSSIARVDAVFGALVLFGLLAVPAMAAMVYQAVTFG